MTQQRPVDDDEDAWKACWKAQGHPWRSEPEIDIERQKYLAVRRTIVSDIKQGIYPYKDMKLSRADIEWLLATHEIVRGPLEACLQTRCRIRHEKRRVNRRTMGEVAALAAASKTENGLTGRGLSPDHLRHS